MHSRIFCLRMVSNSVDRDLSSASWKGSYRKPYDYTKDTDSTWGQPDQEEISCDGNRFLGFADYIEVMKYKKKEDWEDDLHDFCRLLGGAELKFIDGVFYIKTTRKQLATYLVRRIKMIKDRITTIDNDYADPVEKAFRFAVDARDIEEILDDRFGYYVIEFAPCDAEDRIGDLDTIHGWRYSLMTKAKCTREEPEVKRLEEIIWRVEGILDYHF